MTAAGVASLVAASLLASSAHAAPGDLDPTFSGDGKLTVDFGRHEEAFGVAPDPAASDAIVAAGFTADGPDGGNSDVAVARITSTGGLDPTFSLDGLVTTDISGSNDRAFDVAVQSDGKIVAVGSSVSAADGPSVLALRYNADGTLDPSFSSDGIVLLPIGPAATGVAIQPDGMIVVAGAGASGTDMVVARLEADGDLDPSFSGDGVQTVGFLPCAFARDVALDASGRIVTVGGNCDHAVGVRLTADGSVDGRFQAALDDLPVATGVAVDADGRPLVPGGSGIADAFAVARLQETTGDLDTTFAGDGIWEASFSGGRSAEALAQQPNTKLVAAGYVGALGSGSVDFVMARVLADGTADGEVGGGTGFVTTDFGAEDVGRAAGVQTDGRIVLAGSSLTLGFGDFAVARYLGDDPTKPETTITSGPADGSSITDATPTFTFTSSEPGSTFECRVDSEAFTACTSPQTTAPLSDGQHSFAVRAIDASGQADPTPATRTFTVDTVAPDTTITSGPVDGSTITTATPTFAFTASEPGAGFQCRVDSAAFGACTPPHTTPALADGQHTFEVRAVDAAGNVDANPATRTFTVDATPPDTTITSGPANGSATNDNTPSFGFTSEPGATFECRLDGAAFAACTSPHTTTALTDGQHTFEVRAVDGAGNPDPTPASRTFTVDTAPPNTQLSSTVPFWTNDPTPTFVFDSADGNHFECRIDSAAFAACQSPHTVGPLADGPHRFEVRALDAAGNVDPTPAAHDFNVDTVPPNTTISDGPADGSTITDTTPTFSFFTFEFPPATFLCKVDGGSFGGCTSPHTVGPLSPGAHFFRVAALDAAGNQDPTPALRSFTVAQSLGCPSTVGLPMVELRIAPGAPAGACFKATDLGSRDEYLAPKNQKVLANGLLIEPVSGVAIKATLNDYGKGGRCVTVKSLNQSGGAGKATIRITGSNTNVTTVSAPVSWSFCTPNPLPSPFSLKPQTLKISGGTLLGLPVGGADVPLTITHDAKALVPLRVQMPEPLASLFDLAGVMSTEGGTVTTSNAAGLSLDSFAASFSGTEIPLGLFRLRDITLAYERQGNDDVWKGEFGLVFPDINAGALQGSIAVKNGSFAGGHVTIPTEIPIVPPLVFLESVSGDLTVEELQGQSPQLTITALVRGGPLISTPWGNVRLATLNGEATIFFDPPAKSCFETIGKQCVEKPYFGSNATLHVLGIPLGGVHYLLGAQQMRWGGSFDKTFLDVAGFKLRAYGAFNGRLDWDGAFKGSFSGTVCLLVLGCPGGKGIYSNWGVSACGKVFESKDWSGWGGWVRYTGQWGTFPGCNWNKVRSYHPRAVVGRPGGVSGRATPALTVPHGLRRVIFEFDGSGAPPQLEVTDPSGRTFTTPTETTIADDYAWLIDPSASAAFLVLDGPAPGRWQATPVAGSAPLTAISRFEPLPANPVKRARVTGQGHDRELHYSVVPAQGQRITFVEESAGADRVIGRARGARGSVDFSPAEGPSGRRTIIAEVERRGIPLPRIEATTYKAPPPILPKAPRLRVRRAGSTLVANWTRVARATAYRVIVTFSDGHQIFRFTTDRTQSFEGLTRRMGARVEVRGVTAGLRPGRTGKARLDPLPAVRAPDRVSVGALRGHGVSVGCTASADGVCEVRLMRGRKLVGKGDAEVAYDQTAKVRVRLSKRARREVEPGDRLRLVTRLPGEKERVVRILVR
jgi:uncharacterized delta-60 repeat protein